MLLPPNWNGNIIYLTGVLVQTLIQTLNNAKHFQSWVFGKDLSAAQPRTHRPLVSSPREVLPVLIDFLSAD